MNKKQVELKKRLDYSFDNVQMLDDEFFTFDWIKGNSFVILTNNVRHISEYYRAYNSDNMDYMLFTSKHSGILLKMWNLHKIKTKGDVQYKYAVKLNKRYDEILKTKFTFDDLEFEKADTIESLLELSKKQSEMNIPIAVDFDWKGF